jgi:hypothetical protein
MNKTKSEQKPVLIESEGLLYRGPTANHPTEIWDYPRGRWVRYMDAGPKQKGWGKRITSTQAARLKTNNPSAEHFLYYDMPPWSQNGTSTISVPAIPASRRAIQKQPS